MGLLIAIARKVELRSAIFDHERDQIKIRRAKSSLASKISDYEMTRSDYDPNSAEAKAFEQRIARLNEVDKRLDEKLEKIETQLKLCQAEMDTLKDMEQSSIQRIYGN